MVKAPVKRKQKNKVKQKVKVSQNVKVVIGDIKRKRQVRRLGAGKPSGGPAKPPMVINVTTPQPASNPYIAFFKEMMQNQQQVQQANTLQHRETQIEKEETRASRVGMLNRLDQEPNDMAREMKMKKEDVIRQVQQNQQQIQDSIKAGVDSLTTPKKVIIKKSQIKTPNKREVDSTEREMIQVLQQRQTETENAINKAEQESGAPEEKQSEPTEQVSQGVTEGAATPVKRYVEQTRKQPKPKSSKKRRGRKKLSEEVIQARLAEEDRLRSERIQMIAEDKPRRGRKMLSQAEVDKRRKERELMKLKMAFQPSETDEDMWGNRGDY